MKKKILFCVFVCVTILVLVVNVSAKIVRQGDRNEANWGKACIPTETIKINGQDQVISKDTEKCEKNERWVCELYAYNTGLSNKNKNPIYKWHREEYCGADKYCYKEIEVHHYTGGGKSFTEIACVNDPNIYISGGIGEEKPKQVCKSTTTKNYDKSKEELAITNYWATTSYETKPCINKEDERYPESFCDNIEYDKYNFVKLFTGEIMQDGTHTRTECISNLPCGDKVDNDVDDYYKFSEEGWDRDSDKIIDWFVESTSYPWKPTGTYTSFSLYPNPEGTDCEDWQDCGGKTCAITRIPQTQEEAKKINMEQKEFVNSCYAVPQTNKVNDVQMKEGECVPDCDTACKEARYDENYRDIATGGLGIYKYEYIEGKCYKSENELVTAIRFGGLTSPVSQEDINFVNWLVYFLNPIASKDVVHLEDMIKKDELLKHFRLSEGDPYCLSQNVNEPTCYCRRYCCGPPLREPTKEDDLMMFITDPSILSGFLSTIGSLVKYRQDKFDVAVKKVKERLETEMLRMGCRKENCELWCMSLIRGAGLTDMDLFELAFASSLYGQGLKAGYNFHNMNEYVKTRDNNIAFVKGEKFTFGYLYGQGIENINKMAQYKTLNLCPNPEIKIYCPKCGSGLICPTCNANPTKSQSIYLIRQFPFESSGIAYQFNPKGINFSSNINIRFNNINTINETYLYKFDDEDVLVYCDVEILSEKSKIIGKEGGSIHTEDVIYDVPQGALSKNVTIRIRKLNLICNLSQEREINYSLIDYYEEPLLPPTPPPVIISADTNNDGKVDDKEILAFIDKAIAENISATKVIEEINKWKYS